MEQGEIDKGINVLEIDISGGQCVSGFESRDWYYNEFQHVGVDFESVEEVECYDDEIGKGINRPHDLLELVEALGLKQTDSILEM